MHDNLSVINPEWIQITSKKVSVNIPKEQIAKERVEHFLKVREADRERMIQLRQQQLMNLNKSTMSYENIVGKTR